MSQVTVTPELGPCVLGEGPHWDHVSKQLYFVDILDQKLYRFDPVTKQYVYAIIDHGPVGFILPVAGTTDKFVVGAALDFALVTWNETNQKCPIKILATADGNKADARWNDGKVDPAGRFWGGTMGHEKNGVFPPNLGSLYMLDNNLVLKKQESPVTISNGLAWSLNNDTLYYIDSPTCQIVAYDYNLETGAISNKRIVFDLKEHKVSGFPDGMTIDTDGNLWVAVYGGSGVIQINPRTNQLLRFVKIEGAKNITSVAFGGPDLDILYVTSSKTGLNENELKDQPYAGFLFTIKGLGVRGFTANSFKLPTQLT